MKTLFKYRTIFLVILLGCVAIPQKRRLIAQETLKMTLVKDLKLPEATRMTVFDFTDPQNPKPKVEIFDQKIVFYDENGNVIANKVYPERIAVSYSQNKRFFIVGFVKEYPTATKVGIYQIDFYDKRGEKYFSTTTELDEDLPPSQFKISDTGNIVELNPAKGKLVFYNKAGLILKERTFFQYSDMGTALSCTFSPNKGNLLLLGINYPGFDTSSEIILYDIFGNEKWRFKRNQRYVSSQLFISPDERYIISSYYNQPKYDRTNKVRAAGPEYLVTYILNGQDGSIVSELPNVRCRAILFYNYNSTDYALINDVGDQILSVNLANGNIENIHSVPQDEEILGFDIDIYTQKIVLIKSKIKYKKLAGRGYRLTFTRPMLVFFDFKWNLITRKNVPVSSIREHLLNGELKFINSGQNLLIYLKNARELMIFAIH